MNWTFEQNSILHNYSPYTPCKEIFQAICDEIGRYYVAKGWKYARSRPKITFKNKEIKIEIAFWSSGSNTPGDYVNLEILPHISSLELVKYLKGQGVHSKGYILGFNHLYTERYDQPKKGLKKIINIRSEDLERKEGTVSEILFNKNVNVYGIDENDFYKIIEFLEDRVICWIDKINNEQGINTFLGRLTDRDKKSLLKSDFGKFMKMKFPNT